jgi:Ca-activated chloride channel homolog
LTFLWPGMLWLLLAVPLVLAGWVVLQRRRLRTAARHASLGFAGIQQGNAGAAMRSLRYLPPILLLLAIALFIGATARPVTMLTLPIQHETVILALDISGSMRADDVKPSRIEAAQAASKAFIDQQPRTTRIGIVTFAGSASLTQPPTLDRGALHAAIDRIQLQRATALGSALVIALAAVFPDDGIDLARLESRQARRAEGQGSGPPPGRGAASTPATPATPAIPSQPGGGAPARAPVAPGSYTSAAIVLISDGTATTGYDPVAAAKLAAERGVRVYTVGIGTSAGAVLRHEGWSMRVTLDEASLKEIAAITNGEYFQAGSAPDLSRVYQSLTSRFMLEQQRTEVTSLVALAGMLFALMAAGLSLFWYNRIL